MLRAYVFGRLLRWMRRRTPTWFVSIELQILLELTARAYRMPGRGIWFLPAKRALREYASFTVRCMESGKKGAEKLYPSAYALGKWIRWVTGFKQPEDLRQLIFWLYRNIGIDMRGKLPGELIISRCYFSRYYTPEQCALMSNVDAGVIAGLVGGGELVFTERITEGCGRCRACFRGRGIKNEQDTQ